MILKDQLRKNGYDYKLEASTPNAAIYHQTFRGQHIGYEVFRKPKPSKLRNHYFPADSDFGVTAWAYQSISRAWAKYREFAGQYAQQATQISLAA